MTAPNHFREDDKWQRGIRDRILCPVFYRSYAVEGRYVVVDKGRLATLLQRRCAVDTFLQGEAGACLCAEEKIVRWPKRGVAYDAYALETMSCTVPGHESPGWMRYGRADLLVYCFHQADDSLIVHVIPFRPLQQWFWPNETRFSTFGPLDTRNRSMGRVVLISDVADEIGVEIFHVRAGAVIETKRRRPASRQLDLFALRGES
jgi:hypothetical protein